MKYFIVHLYAQYATALQYLFKDASLNRNIVVSRWKSTCMLRSQELWQIWGRCRKNTTMFGRCHRMSVCVSDVAFVADLLIKLFFKEQLTSLR